MDNVKVVVPWHREAQIAEFLNEWDVDVDDPRLLLVQDDLGLGCAKTKNRGILRAIEDGADVVIVLDDDCFPAMSGLDEFIENHLAALEPQPVELFKAVTDPPSRGTPYQNRTVTMPVAASMGFWQGVPDLDAASQLVHARHRIKFKTKPIHGKYFPLCGMNIAFRANQFPWCLFVDVPRFDDIWQGFLWQRHAYAHGYCFNLNGPMVYHSRQSNVWENLKQEAQNLPRNETIWQDIHAMPLGTHSEMLAKLGLTT